MKHSCGDGESGSSDIDATDNSESDNNSDSGNHSMIVPVQTLSECNKAFSFSMA